MRSHRCENSEQQRTTRELREFIEREKRLLMLGKARSASKRFKFRKRNRYPKIYEGKRHTYEQPNKHYVRLSTVYRYEGIRSRSKRESSKTNLRSTATLRFHSLWIGLLRFSGS